MGHDQSQLRKIAVVGWGAVGSFYGSRLARSGPEVHFLLRSDFDAVSANGLRVQSADGNYTLQPSIARSPSEIGECDLVLIALKSTANHRFAELLAPLVGEQTVLFTLQNGLGNEPELALLFPGRPVFGGMCFVCLNRTAPGVIHHIAHGKIVMGRHGGPPDELTECIAGLIRASGIPVDVSPDLERAHWEKLIWNIPFNGLGVAGAAGLAAVLAGDLPPGQPIGPCLATDSLLDEGPWEQLITGLMDEVIAAGRAQGHDLSPGLGQYQRDRTRVMGAYRASTLIDFENARPLELEALFRKPLAAARAAGVDTPRLAKLCTVLEQLVAEQKNSVINVN